MGGAAVKKTTIMAFCAGLMFLQANAAENQSARTWSSGSAYILPAHRWETGVFLPLRWGCSESMELSMHPLAAFVMPNLSAKWSHGVWNDFIIATRHSLYCPTPLLRLLAREGTGGIISPQFHIPAMISISNEILVSRLWRNVIVTGKAGLAFALKSASVDENSTIDLPLVFTRLNVFYRDYGFRSGMALCGTAYKRWDYNVDAEVFYYPRGSENWAFEHKGLLLWTKSAKFQLCLGYKLSFAQYPFGDQWHLLAPLFDLQWGWK